MDFLTMTDFLSVFSAPMLKIGVVVTEIRPKTLFTLEKSFRFRLRIRSPIIATRADFPGGALTDAIFSRLSFYR